MPSPRGADGPIRWLASYPKSGNTWTRALLSAYQVRRPEQFHINRLVAPYVTAGRDLLEDYLGVESSDLLPEEIERLWPAVYREAAATTDEPLLWKTHLALRKPLGVAPLIPPETCGPAVYIVRNPLDVAVSFAHHQGWSVERSVQEMSNPDYHLGGGGARARAQTTEYIGHWSDHVRSWLDQTDIDVLLVRYEDLHADTAGTLCLVLRHFGTDVDTERVEAAVARAAFDRLKEQEAHGGFTGKNPATGTFFRAGRVGSWRETLAPDLQRRLRTDHREMMERLGYADL